MLLPGTDREWQRKWVGSLMPNAPRYYPSFVALFLSISSDFSGLRYKISNRRTADRRRCARDLPPGRPAGRAAKRVHEPNALYRRSNKASNLTRLARSRSNRESRLQKEINVRSTSCERDTTDSRASWSSVAIRSYPHDKSFGAYSPRILPLPKCTSRRRQKDLLRAAKHAGDGITGFPLARSQCTGGVR